MLQRIQKLINKLKVSEKGQGMVEYALIIAFVAAIAIFALNGGLKTAVSSAFDKAKSNVTQATDKAGDTSGNKTDDTSSPPAGEG